MFDNEKTGIDGKSCRIFADFLLIKQSALHFKDLLGIPVEHDRVNVTGTVHDADDNQVLVRRAEVSAICAERMHAQARPQPVSGNARHADTGHAVQIGDEPGDEPLGGLGAVGGNVIVDAVQISAGRIGDDEFAAWNGCGLLERDAAYGGCRVAASPVRAG